MRKCKYFELQDLEDFFLNNDINISRATITRYGQQGIILEPHRKTSLSTLSDSRIYYNPLVAIEIITANMMFSGNYISKSGYVKTARFTSDDVFFARLAFYTNSIETNGQFRSTINNYSTTFRINNGKKNIYYTLPFDTYTLGKIFDAKFSADENTPEHFKILNDRFLSYYNIFTKQDSYDPCVWIPDCNLQNCYFNVAVKIYSNIFMTLLNKYESMIHTFDY